MTELPCIYVSPRHNGLLFYAPGHRHHGRVFRSHPQVRKFGQPGYHYQLVPTNTVLTSEELVQVEQELSGPKVGKPEEYCSTGMCECPMCSFLMKQHKH